MTHILFVLGRDAVVLDTLEVQAPGSSNVLFLGFALDVGDMVVPKATKRTDGHVGNCMYFTRHHNGGLVSDALIQITTSPHGLLQ